jgi:hypothetical protein
VPPALECGGSNKRNGPKVQASLKTWLYAGNSEYPALLAVIAAVKMRPVRTISREVARKRLTPQRLYAGLRCISEEEIVRTARRRVEVGGNDQPARPCRGLVKVGVKDL